MLFSHCTVATIRTGWLQVLAFGKCMEEILMKMVSKTAASTCTCQLQAAKELHFSSCVDCLLAVESVGYAACRFIRRSPALRHTLTQESYRLRLAKGRERRKQYHSFVAPAALMELPGAWVSVRLTVDPEGVTVEGMSLSEEYPYSRPGKRRDSARNR